MARPPSSGPRQQEPGWCYPTSGARRSPRRIPGSGRRSGSDRTWHTLVCDTIVCMAQVDRFSVTMPPELGEGVRQAAARQGTSVSTWLTEAAAEKLRNELLGAALDQWEAEDGPFTQAELDQAASRLGLAPRSDVACRRSWTQARWWRVIAGAGWTARSGGCCRTRRRRRGPGRRLLAESGASGRH